MISSTVFFALLSMICAGGNDVVFKRYAAKSRSRGAYVFGIGLVWASLQIVYAIITGAGFDASGTSLSYGVAAGVLLTISNLLLLESLTHIDASLGSTIYRLNTVGVVLLSIWVLDESLGWMKGLGVAMAIGAVFLLYHPSGKGEATGKQFVLFFALAIFASACRAVYGVVTKVGLNDGASTQSMLVVAAICWIIGGAMYALIREKRLRITGKKAIYSLLSGVLVFLIVNFLILAIEKGQASIAIPIANMGFIVALTLSVGLGMEIFTRRKLLAVTVSICSLLILSQA
ncbi:MAG: EamA family transporter [Gammaproteobacteria bacterium]|nr:EamA family transporter [Gammaproteobacteria bacterium]